MRASRKISHTDVNQDRKFFESPRYVSKVDRGCEYFVWYEVKVAAMKEMKTL
ncbi:hypothetical protein LINPERHAP1_LOCUS18774 [Linum perenne]